MPQPRGFALLDALFATTLLIVCVLSLAQLFVLAARANEAARQMTMGSILAAQKMEELRFAPRSAGFEGSDRIDEFTRQWAITPFGGDPQEGAVLDVRVTPGGVRLLTLRKSEDDP